MLRPFRKTWTRAVALWMVLSFIGSSVPAPGQGAPPFMNPAPPAPEAAPAPPPAAAGSEKMISLNFRDAPLDQVLTFYAELTGRTLIKSPGINATITIRGQTPLTQTEAMQAIESVLAMNNVTLVPMGTKFLKVVQPTAARQEGMQISGQLPEKPFPETDHLISQIITLKYLEIADAQTVIQGFLHGYGKIQPLERMNSLLITDTGANLQRIMEILEYIDQPTEAKVETRIYELKYAEASKIAGRLNELIQDAQAKDEKPRIAAAVAQPPSPPGVIRARALQVEAHPEAAAEAALAERGIVQGKVKIVADERTNILIVISRPSNFTFFDKIVAILDRPVEPEILVRVVALEYAKAEEIASILNEFVGAAKAESKVVAPQQGAAEGTAPATQAEAARGQALQDYITRRAEERLRAAVGEEKARIGQLSPNTKILADKRTNSLLLMGTKSDVAALEDVIDKLDTMLAQVLIEAVILEVGLTKNLEYGLDWLQRSMVAYNENLQGPNGGVLVREPLFSYGGGSRMGDGTSFRDGASIQRNDPVIGAGGLTYFTTLYDLNIDAVIRMAAGSSDARILSTPVILTTDNTEAKIIVGEERPVVTTTSTSDAGQQTSSYEYRNIGINLTVTPRINPQRYVVMEISQTADNVGGFEVIDGNNVPIITKREMQAQIAVPSRSTIALGGLVSTDRRKSRAKVPILGDIPVLGTLFRADTDKNNRTELLVLLTPYVLTSPEEARRETERLHAATRASQSKWYRGWSDSPLTRPTEAQQREEKKAERAARKQRALFEPQREGSAPAEVQMAPRVTVVVPSEMEGGVDQGIADQVEPEPAPVVLPPPAEQPEPAPAVVPNQPTVLEPTGVAPEAVPDLETPAGDVDDPGEPVPLN
ncbi:MAG: type II secretion system secretin GspD [Verrucomicrobiota bacterium]